MKTFSKNDNSFICVNCGKKVKKLGYTSRNHCPYCLCSVHVDNTPGDRQNSCKGLLEPVDVQINSKKGMVIVHKCSICGEVKKNVSAQDDNQSLILKIISKR